MSNGSQGATSERAYGKHRGQVVENVDPMQIGRVKALVSDVLGSPLSSWALPCAPMAGSGAGVLAVPPLGSNVWVEFERGDVDLPIWVGGFWSTAAEVPPMILGATPGSSAIALQTALGNGIVISDAADADGGILISTPTGAMISVREDGIVISNGRGATISLTGPTTDINHGGLTVV